ncbi:hypothetical protein IWQ62_000889 [Dispira parvispora]|uniref:Uncharacterized protein n=1 Tax=Dispira parvispora TaxID=1520584 RepID=A0A9W8E968_9FUNG|nr:hypothetical protein IWQ62_000889 [Dispira parvispora]
MVALSTGKVVRTGLLFLASLSLACADTASFDGLLHSAYNRFSFSTMCGYALASYTLDSSSGESPSAKVMKMIGEFQANGPSSQVYSEQEKQEQEALQAVEELKKSSDQLLISVDSAIPGIMPQEKFSEPSKCGVLIRKLKSDTSNENSLGFDELEKFAGTTSMTTEEKLRYIEKIVAFHLDIAQLISGALPKEAGSSSSGAGSKRPRGDSDGENNNDEYRSEAGTSNKQSSTGGITGRMEDFHFDNTDWNGAHMPMPGYDANDANDALSMLAHRSHDVQGLPQDLSYQANQLGQNAYSGANIPSTAATSYDTAGMPNPGYMPQDMSHNGLFQAPSQYMDVNHGAMQSTDLVDGLIPEEYGYLATADPSVVQAKFNEVGVFSFLYNLVALDTDSQLAIFGKLDSAQGEQLLTGWAAAEPVSYQQFQNYVASFGPASGTQFY